jgi:hypothetical protein
MTDHEAELEKVCQRLEAESVARHTRLFEVGQPIHPDGPEAARLLREMAAENERLRGALADLASWFTSPMIGDRVWIIPAGELGADAAVESARQALTKGKPHD